MPDASTKDLFTDKPLITLPPPGEFFSCNGEHFFLYKNKSMRTFAILELESMNMEERLPPRIISLGKRLRKSRIRCVGVKPNWPDYPEELQREIVSSEKVCYPGPVYADIFEAAGLSIFPRNYYRFLGDKIAQTDLFNLLGIPHPRTGIYYGKDRFKRIESDFSYPFIAKTPVGSSQGRGVFLIHGPEDLSRYLEAHNPAYIQEYIAMERDLRVVVICGRPVHAYWRMHREGDFRNNIAQGGTMSFENIPAAAIDFAVDTALKCRFDEAGLDICEHAGTYCVLEANMVFGQEGFRKKGLDVHRIIADLSDFE
jgi:ribosomal protein S6--L-glutamate ligase